MPRDEKPKPRAMITSADNPTRSLMLAFGHTEPGGLIHIFIERTLAPPFTFSEKFELAPNIIR